MNIDIKQNFDNHMMNLRKKLVIKLKAVKFLNPNLVQTQ